MFLPFKQEEFLKTIRKALPYSDCPNGFTALRAMIFAPQIIFSPCFDCLLQAEPVKTLSEMVFFRYYKKGGTTSGRTENGTSKNPRLHQSEITVYITM